jgi:hypothetical protein
MINLEKNNFNNSKDGQLDIDFEKGEINADFERANKIIKELNTKYPFAELRIEYIGNKQYLVGDTLIKERDLDKKFKTTHDAYKPSEKEQWYDRL